MTGLLWTHNATCSLAPANLKRPRRARARVVGGDVEASCLGFFFLLFFFFWFRLTN